MRLGIHSGELVGGIVGVKKFQFDVFGDTVNTASPMESHGQIMQLNVSAATAALLNPNEFLIRPRGSLEVKGKGKMPMYLVEKNRPTQVSHF